ncbi:unnamed protein product [Clonostachys chloroleuca]|uniref:Alpha-N-arabinofuranosidase n=1 Tax=Clonostachys chloroleuca TaxID=1926264 RepID=A0AA35MD06_9HYPO|nr:unnamed protein product [Clonostachys chloroleuca]
MSNKVIAHIDTPDPWMVQANGVYYLTFTLANRIEIWESPLMEDFFNARKALVWQPEPGSRWAADIWAPELHLIKGVWYIYATASQPGVGNPGHRTIVLRSASQDPMEEAAWEFIGPLKGMPEAFSIDATVFSPNGEDLYICWSGWPVGDNSDTKQDLYVTQMISPEEVVDSSILPPACIACADLPWERFDGGRRGINEGPTWLNLPNGAFTGIVFSGHASFTSEYKLGLLRLVAPNADPLDPKSWEKRPVPLLMNDKSMPGPYAPGHASFLLSSEPGDDKVFCIYHATDNWGEGFANRKARVIVMGPEHFAPDAQPICCSKAPDNPFWRGGATVDSPQRTLSRRSTARQKIDEFANWSLFILTSDAAIGRVLTSESIMKRR